MALKNVRFKISELNELVSKKKSCVRRKENCFRKLFLMPIQLLDLKASVRDCLDSQVTTYDEELQGIILSFKNVKVFTLAEEDPGNVLIPVNFVADIYIFKPKLGSVLKGTVTKKTNKQIGCIVYKVFNVTILCPDDTPHEEWSGNNVDIDDEVSFKVTFMNLTGQIPYIRGAL